ncbi:hypothetical protein TURU_158904 [Turdus rufiventris]|nr:hypothetical protein TURU_158904 [Turdus rufiventris]
MVCARSPEGQLHPGLCHEQWEQQGERGDSTLVRPPPAVLCPGLESLAHERAGSEEGYSNDWGLEYLSYKEGWGELEFFSTEEKSLGKLHCGLPVP